MHHPSDMIAHTTTFVEHWLESEIAQWVDREGLIRGPIVPWACALYGATSLNQDVLKETVACSTTTSLVMASFTKNRIVLPVLFAFYFACCLPILIRLSRFNGVHLQLL